jgi:hypothetical protein
VIPNSTRSFIDGNGITLSGGNLSNASGVIASFDITTTPGQLVISFSDAAAIPTSADVDFILQQIAYANNLATPPTSAQIDWTFDDGDGAATSASTTVTINADTPATIGGDISYAGDEGDTVGGTMTATDINGLTDGTYFTVTAAATNGTAAINPTSGVWTFTPTDPNWFGSDNFTVTVTDDLGGTTDQVVNIRRCRWHHRERSP